MIEAEKPKVNVLVLFWCINCHNAILETPATCHHIERIVYLRARSKYYRCGWCTECWRTFHPITADDKLALHEALESMTSLRDITDEPIAPVVERMPKAA